MALVTITKNLSDTDRKVFVEGVAPLCQNIAIDHFVEFHHREPKPQEAAHLGEQYIDETVQFVQSKVDRFHQASGLLLEFLPQIFSKEVTELVVADLKKGVSTASEGALNVSTDTLTQCFEVGKFLFKERKYSDAGAIFEMLVFLNPHFTTAWLDLGLCLQEQGQLQEALKAYAATYFLDPKPLYARLKSIEAYLALHQKADAMAEFDELEQLVYMNPDEQWKETLRSLAKKLGESK